MFVVITESNSFSSCSIIDKETFNEYLNPCDNLYESESYTKCEIWIANKLAEERIAQWKQDKLETELNALENQSVEC